jgi:hypothetical protein
VTVHGDHGGAARAPQAEAHAAAPARAAEATAAPELGNQAMQALMAAGLRARLEVGGADDPEERAADQLAELALSGRAVSPCACGGGDCPTCGGTPKVRRKATDGGGGAPAAISGFGNRGGRPLDAGARRYFEPRFGADLGGVRIHDDPATHRFARGIGARAFAIGSDIGFAADRHNPQTADGRSLLAHELAHVALGHGGVRRDPDGEGRITAPAKPAEEAKETTPIRPSVGFFRYRGVVVADDAEFMRGELRRLVAQVGMVGAFEWVMQLTADRGMPPEPGLLERVFAPLPRPRSPLDAMQDMEAEQSRRTIAEKAIPTVQSVFREVATEAMDFLTAFEATGISITQSILASSEAKAEAEKLRYGLERTTESTVTYRRDGEGGTVADYKSTTTHSMEDQLPGQGLAGAAKDLLAKRTEVDDIVRRQASLYEVQPAFSEYETPDLYVPSEHQAEFDRLGKDIADKRGELALLEGIYQDRYPVLARISADVSALKQVAQGPSGRTAEVLNEQIFGTLDNIAQVRGELRPGGDVKIWKLPDIVALAKSASGCNDSTSLARMRTRLVNDKVQQVEDDEFWRNLVLGALAIGLAVLAAIPSGGSSLIAGAAVVAGLGSFALSAFQAAEHLDQYMIEKAMAGSDLDRARAIGASDPSLFWLAIDIVGAMADLGPAVRGTKAMLTAGRSAFRSVSGAARRFLAATPEAAAAELATLRKVAQGAEQAAGIPGLAARVVGSAERLGSSGASVEKTLASAAGHEASAVSKGTAQIEKAVAKRIGSSPTRLGGHTVSVAPNGSLIRCSSPACATLRAQFSVELGRSPELARRLAALEKRAADAAETALHDPVLAKQLADQVAADTALVADKLEVIRRTGDIRAYRGVDLAKVDDIFLLDQRLVVEMPYAGVGAKSTTAEGWLRSGEYYWEELLRRHPGAFSEANKQKILGGPPLNRKLSPVNDPTFQAYFPQYDVKGLRSQKLVHHHIGGGGQAAAVPEPIHPGGKAVIHKAEEDAGIWGADADIAEMLQRLLDNPSP